MSKLLPSRIWILMLAMSVLTLAVVACSDSPTQAPPAATPVPAPTATPGVETIAQSDLNRQLRSNADGFQYAIGNYGGSITYATISEPLTFNLPLAADSGSATYLGYLFEGLTQSSWLTDEIEPMLAESWERSEDGLVWTFKLREDVRWHDGTPFTARDVDFTFNKILFNEDIPSPDGASFRLRFQNDAGEWQEEWIAVTALDDYTVQCVLPVPFATFIRAMGTAIYPRHILESYVDNGTFEEVWDIDSDPSEVIGTGPFTITEYVPEESVTLRRHPDYWLQDAEGNTLPYLDEIRYLIVPDFEAELVLFKSGETDYHGVLGEEYEELKAMEESGNFTIHRRGPTFGSTFITFNQNPESDPETGDPLVAPEKSAWFQNTDFRRAVAYSMDRSVMIEEIYHGLGYPQWSPVSPSTGDFHNPNVASYEYSPAKANAILDDLGWVDTDGDGIREDDEGNSIEFELITNDGNSVRARVGQLISDNLARIGIMVDFQIIPFGELVDRIVSPPDNGNR